MPRNEAAQNANQNQNLEYQETTADDNESHAGTSRQPATSSEDISSNTALSSTSQSGSSSQEPANQQVNYEISPSASNLETFSPQSKWNSSQLSGSNTTELSTQKAKRGANLKKNQKARRPVQARCKRCGRFIKSQWWLVSLTRSVSKFLYTTPWGTYRECSSCDRPMKKRKMTSGRLRSKISERRKKSKRRLRRASRSGTRTRKSKISPKPKQRSPRRKKRKRA